MKSGIFKLRNNGRLVYIAKDRSVRSYTNDTGETWAATDQQREKWRVTTREKDAVIAFEDGTVGDRVADVPNGCNDPVKALNDTKHALAAKAVLSGEVSPEWKAGREDKPFSSLVVQGTGPGFLSPQAAKTEQFVLAHASVLSQLAEKGVIHQIGPDEWEVVDGDAYNEALTAFDDACVAFDGASGIATMPELRAVDVDTLVKHTLETKADVFDRAADIYMRHHNPSQVYTLDDAKQAQGRAKRFVGLPPSLGLPYGETADSDAQHTAMRRLGYRRCHKQSARKHLKAGHIVIAAGDGAFWWIKPAAAQAA